MAAMTVEMRVTHHRLVTTLIGAAAGGCSVWDYYGPCVPYMQIVTTSGIPYSVTVDDAAEPTWRP
jgi:hypothetical protein